MAGRDYPTFGEALLHRICAWIDDGTRALGDGPHCGKTASIHVRWADTQGSPMTFLCAQHMKFVLATFRYHAYHKVGADCGMPGAYYDREKNECRCDGSFEFDETVIETPVEPPKTIAR